MRSHTCPKCQTSMEQGFILAAGDSYRRAAGWVAGRPKKHWLLGLKLNGTPTDIQTWRCGRCGFLENYALS